MFSQIHYLIRSKTDGKYLVAKPNATEDQADTGYLLLFRENFEALSYLNKFAPDMVEHFTVESISGNQLKSLLERWGYQGIGLVTDTLIPRVEFMSYNG